MSFEFLSNEPVFFKTFLEKIKLIVIDAFGYDVLGAFTWPHLSDEPIDFRLLWKWIKNLKLNICNYIVFLSDIRTMITKSINQVGCIDRWELIGD